MTEKELQFFIDNGVVENRYLEYKKELKIDRDKEKKEFLADISSFANASGGKIIYGISEERETGKPKEIVGIDFKNVDQEIQKLDNIIKTGIEPRIVGIEIIPIKIQNSKFVITISIPKSWISPHRVIFDNHGHFYIRTSNVKHRLDVSELRVAFNITESATERIKNFRANRVASIISAETPVNFINNSSKVLLHLVPLNSLTAGTLFNIESAQWDQLRPLHCNGWDNSYNFDGYLAYAKDKYGKCYSYTQLYRNGIVEAVQGDLFELENENKYFNAYFLEGEILKGLKHYLLLQSSIGVPLPIFIFLTFTGCKGASLQKRYVSFGKNNSNADDIKIDRDILFFPEILLDSYEIKPHIFFRPVLDSIWNACGYAGCANYDDDGNWGKT